MSALAPCAPPADHLVVDGGLAILRPLMPDEPERIQEGLRRSCSGQVALPPLPRGDAASDRDRAASSRPGGRLRAGSRGRHDRHPRRRHRAVGEVRRRAARRRARRRGRRPLPATRDRPGAGGDRRRRRRQGGRRPGLGHRPPREQDRPALDAGRRRPYRDPAMRASSSSRRRRWPTPWTSSGALGSPPEGHRPSRATAPAGPLAQHEPSYGHCTAWYAVSSKACQCRPPS